MTHAYSESEFKNIEKGTYFNLSLEKTDRNGTKYFNGVQRCWKCLGNKVFDCWGHVANGVCFACNGSGVNDVKVKVMTDEHAQKLYDARAKKSQKEIEDKIAHSEEKNREFAIKQGFSADGFAYVVFTENDDDSYAIREELKEKGAKYWGNGVWYFSENHEEYECLKVSIEDCFEKDMYNCFHTSTKCGMFDAIHNRREEIRLAKASVKEYYGAVGDKIAKLDVTFVNRAYYDSTFNGREVRVYIYTFEDSENHVFVWKTSSGFAEEPEIGDKLSIKFTVKEHSEYKDVKQTSILRVKAVA